MGCFSLQGGEGSGWEREELTRALTLPAAGGHYFGQPLTDAVANGTVALERIDDMVLRILTPMFALVWYGPGAEASRGMGYTWLGAHVGEGRDTGRLEVSPRGGGEGGGGDTGRLEVSPHGEGGGTLEG